MEAFAVFYDDYDDGDDDDYDDGDDDDDDVDDDGDDDDDDVLTLPGYLIAHFSAIKCSPRQQKTSRGKKKEKKVVGTDHVLRSSFSRL